MESTWYLGRVTSRQTGAEVAVEVRKADGRLSDAAAKNFGVAQVDAWYGVRASRFKEAVEKLLAGLGQRFTRDAPPPVKAKAEAQPQPEPEPQPVEATPGPTKPEPKRTRTVARKAAPTKNPAKKARRNA